MTGAQRNYGSDPLSSEQACITYLFNKRWPWGFRCPFCGEFQQEIAPAYTVVCRYCRKQTSITAQTIMHGSKKSLASWMRVAWQFCFAEQGLSARRLQQMMELSCYHTAWNWLQKLRMGAALAESTPCEGNVLIIDFLLPVASTSGDDGEDIMLALELTGKNGNHRRLRLTVVDKLKAASMLQAIGRMAAQGSTILTDLQLQVDDGSFYDIYAVSKPTRQQAAEGYQIIEEVQKWLTTLYRGAVDSRYLQSYLDEFSFRHNSAFLQDRLAVLDHLLTGLVKPARRERSAGNSSLRRDGYEK